MILRSLMFRKNISYIVFEKQWQFVLKGDRCLVTIALVLDNWRFCRGWTYYTNMIITYATYKYICVYVDSCCFSWLRFSWSTFPTRYNKGIPAALHRYMVQMREDIGSLLQRYISRGLSDNLTTTTEGLHKGYIFGSMVYHFSNTLSNDKIPNVVWCDRKAKTLTVEVSIYVS